MRRTVTMVTALLLVCLAAPAVANTPDSFTACAKKRPDAPCRTSIAVRAGRTVYLRGKVVPSHTRFEAELWHQAPDLSTELLATVPISDTGRMKYTWETTTADGSQTDPNWFQFRIPGHGDSNDVEVMVFLGE
jgi:hypothetical protein